MSNKLSLMPNIAIPRSRFPQKFNHSFDCFHGDLVPTDAFEIVAGDEFSYTLKSLIRMSTPIVPIMGNIKCRVDAWFVPLRLIWDDAEKFYGDPSNHDKISSITPVDPSTITVPYINSSSNVTTGQFIYSVQDYLGKVDLYSIRTKFGNDTNFGNWLTGLHYSVLKERAYLTIWNDGYRPSLMVPPVLVNKATNYTSYGSASFLANPTLVYPFACLKAFKQYDYFTAGTLSPQYGSAVALPLGEKAPLMVYNSGGTNFTTGNYNLGFAASGSRSTEDLFNGQGIYNSLAGVTQAGVKAYADLSLATAATINEIRYAFQLQKYFERSNYGNRYFEILNAHYGITNPDSRLQRAERLGSHEFYINVSQVVSTADTENGTSGQNLGNTGAVSVTGDKCHLFTKSFSEPGYVMVLMTMKYDRSYASGVLREDIKKNRFEFYSPEFANLGDQATRACEIHLIDGSNSVVNPDAVHSYNEHWAEYRYRKDRVSGSLRPGNSLDIWTLADDFDGVDATPGYTFLAEDRTSLARVLASGLSGPDYIVDTNADIIATRELPLYSIPGLIDHFGAL